jgi:hypothetical protein
MMRFASADEAMRALFVQFGPTDDLDWRFHYGLKAEPIDPHHPDIRTARGSIARTMHFGVVRVDLAAAVVEFIDEDHRDGGDYTQKRADLPADWIAALRATDWPGG